DAMFRIPLVGSLMRAFGAFPVDVRRGKGREAYARAKALVEQGELVGIFPEGKRSRDGWMEESLREGAARLAWETGVPLVPAPIRGALRAWPCARARAGGPATRAPPGCRPRSRALSAPARTTRRSKTRPAPACASTSRST